MISFTSSSTTVIRSPRDLHDKLTNQSDLETSLIHRKKLIFNKLYKTKREKLLTQYLKKTYIVRGRKKFKIYFSLFIIGRE